MARPCSICNHSQAQAINSEMANGAPLRDIATKYGTSRSALSRHGEHRVSTIKTPCKPDTLSQAAREAQREYKRQWVKSLTEEQREKQREYQREWRRMNREKVAEYNRQYWENRANEGRCSL